MTSLSALFFFPFFSPSSFCSRYPFLQSAFKKASLAFPPPLSFLQIRDNMLRPPPRSSLPLFFSVWVVGLNPESVSSLSLQWRRNSCPLFCQISLPPLPIALSATSPEVLAPRQQRLYTVPFKKYCDNIYFRKSDSRLQYPSQDVPVLYIGWVDGFLFGTFPDVEGILCRGLNFFDRRFSLKVPHLFARSLGPPSKLIYTFSL